MHDSLRGFLQSARLPLQVVAEAEGTVQVIASEPPRRCSVRRLYVGGTIACETARAMAGRLGLRVPEMGRLLDFLHIKVRNCGLGCF